MDDLKTKVESKKRNRIIKIAIVVLAIALLLFGFKEYRDGKEQATNSQENIVNIEIRCDELIGNLDVLKDPNLKEYIPEDGIIYKGTCPITSGETTVFEVTDKVCKDNDIQIEYSYTAGYGGYYIEGINYLYEFSAGKYSGWLYTIDGESPMYGADKLTLKGGETIVWNYTVDYRG